MKNMLTNTRICITKESNETFVRSTLLYGGEAWTVSKEITVGNEDVVLETNDESLLDGEKEHCEYSGDYQKRVVGYHNKETDDIFGTRNQNGWSGRSGDHCQNHWQPK